MKIYCTFGQAHMHYINGTVFDADTIAEIECTDYNHGRQIAIGYFGSKFAFAYEVEELSDEMVAHYRKGIVPLERS